MRLEGNKIILEDETCHMCGSNGLPIGKAPSRKPCPTCNGTRRGKRGGRNGCKDCFTGTVADWDNPITCDCCDGLGKVPETMTSFMRGERKREIIDALPIKLFFADRGSTFNEAYLGLGTVYAMNDYGRAWQRLEARDDESINDFLSEIRDDLNETTVQGCKIADKDGTLVNHLLVIVHRNGYSVRPSKTEDSSDVIMQANGEPSEAAGMLLGSLIAGQGGNGTLAAATGKL